MARRCPSRSLTLLLDSYRPCPVRLAALRLVWRSLRGGNQERAFPEAEVMGYRSLVSATSNGPKDRHVVAADVKAGAQVVVTSNIKDFTPLPHGIEAQLPGDFLCHLFDLDPDVFVEMLREQAAQLTRPPVSFEELPDRLTRACPSLWPWFGVGWKRADRPVLGDLAHRNRRVR